MRYTAILPLPAEFIDRCRRDGVTPEDVLLGFMVDLCDIDSDAGHGADVRFLAQEYYALAGYAPR